MNGPADLQPSSAMITSFNVKEGPLKDNMLMAFPDDLMVCPVYTLMVYLYRTAEWHMDLMHDHMLFLSLSLCNQQHQPVSSDTLRQWMKYLLDECGLSGSAHATRGQTSSAVFHNGAALAEVLKSANWHSERTFRKYYFVPPPA